MAEMMDPCVELMRCMREYNKTLTHADWDITNNKDISFNEKDITEEYYKRIESLLEQHEQHTVDSCRCRPIHCRWRLIHCRCRPIHTLLSTGPLKHIELPVDILQLLVSKFDVNAYDTDQLTCLFVAVKKYYYSAIRWLVDHGADRDITDSRIRSRAFENYGKTPIAYLASHPNVPHEIFDLLKTDHNLNSSTLYHLPLHKALGSCHYGTALHLIHIGASASQRNAPGVLPLSMLKSYDCETVIEYNDELFTHLINPATTLDLLGKFSCIVHEEVVDIVRADKVFERLFERMIPQSNLYPYCGAKNGFNSINEWSVHMWISDHFVIQETQSFRGIYLMSLLLIQMDWNIVLDYLVNLSPPDSATISVQGIQQIEAIKKIWRIYADRSRVRPLCTLCIIQIKRNMKSLNEENFQSLPIPPTMRNRLMYRGEAKQICEAYLTWPQCAP